MILVRRDGPEGERDYLGDEGIHCGEGLEVRTAAGAWIRGRYEIAHVQIDGRYERRATLYVSIALDRGCETSVAFPIPRDAVCRRPER